MVDDPNDSSDEMRGMTDQTQQGRPDNSHREMIEQQKKEQQERDERERKRREEERSKNKA